MARIKKPVLQTSASHGQQLPTKEGMRYALPMQIRRLLWEEKKTTLNSNDVMKFGNSIMPLTRSIGVLSLQNHSASSSNGKQNTS